MEVEEAVEAEETLEEEVEEAVEAEETLEEEGEEAMEVEVTSPWVEGHEAGPRDSERIF